ncbi:electron transfer flavoprotein subunit beta [Arthrobacter sp. SRS-W-1-2016]|jgi:electron transfer flavoprotein beta subunit|uniref:electron transfer flavoprotein subunit beta/FixA family protein n=1 Tax=Arthrobacter TaxID=1663 RepID=UPI000990FB61|nr:MULTISPECIES: electron transfer flavoprotein subunit beta/FixA family protein [Arthrobacter]MDQ0209862.1 electron transfer flavoprotein beta subunit [Arthrobacter bambusae]MDQ0233812.1 electron transfer flavoprotein beta subunit [Arthrobacter bambusae]OOP60054.1 electron transfer flavoprotein subunit beta [Arthrobacter sp. SRS-W-1-2016]
MKIVVLVKQVPDTAEERKLDPATGQLDRESTDSVVDEINERALEAALRIKDANKGTEVVAMTMGPDQATQSLRKALSMGADSGVHIVDDSLSGADTGRTAATLAAALRSTGFDVVVAGNESTDGRAGVVPAMIAEHLQLPLLGSLISAEIADDGVRGVRQGEGGTLNVRAGLPAILTVTERFPEARFPNFKGILTAKRKPVTTLSVADLGVAATPSRSVVISTAERPPRAAGRKLIDDGDAASELAEFLVANRLV